MVLHDQLDAMAETLTVLESQIGTLRAECGELRERIELLESPDPTAAVYRDALADFGAAVLAGRVAVAFREVSP